MKTYKLDELQTEIRSIMSLLHMWEVPSPYLNRDEIWSSILPFIFAGKHWDTTLNGPRSLPTFFSSHHQTLWNLFYWECIFLNAWSNTPTWDLNITSKRVASPEYFGGSPSALLPREWSSRSLKPTTHDLLLPRRKMPLHGVVFKNGENLPYFSSNLCFSGSLFTYVIKRAAL